MTKSVVIKKSTKSGKKLMAVFTRDGRTKTIHFGAKNMDDYTITKDKEQRKRYLARHRKNEDWGNAESAGALSRWILWGESTSRRQNVASFKSRFGY